MVTNHSKTHPFTTTLLRCVSMMLIAITYPMAVTADEVLFNAEYKGKYGGMTIKSTRTLVKKDSGGFSIESDMQNLFASIHEKSHFVLNEGILQPQEYRYRRSIAAFKANESLQFDWKAGVAKYRRADKPEKNKDHPIKLGILDPVLYQLQLQREAYAGKEEYSFTFVKPSKVKTLHFKKTGEEPFTVGEKTYTAIKVERVNLDDGKETRVWLIPEFNYQVARIEHVEEDGKKYNIYLTRYHSAENLVDILYKLPPIHTH